MDDYQAEWHRANIRERSSLSGRLVLVAATQLDDTQRSLRSGAASAGGRAPWERRACLHHSVGGVDALHARRQ